MGQAREDLMAPISFKDMISVDYRPGEPEEIKYYAQKRRKQYHGNESKDIDELSMKRDKKLPNLKIPVKGKKGISRFMRKKAIGQAKDDINASVQSADRKPEKYVKPDGKVGIRMVKTDKEVVKKESIDIDRMRFQAAASQKKNQKKTDDAEKKSMAAKADMDMKSKRESVNEVSKAESDKVNAKISKVLGKINFTHVYDKKGGMFKLPRGVKHELTVKKNDLRNATSLIKKDTGEVGSMYKKGEIKLVVAESIDEALTLQQRMKRSRLMKRMKARIKIGRDRARRKMANKQKLEKRAMRQARAQIAKKLTRGIPKGELSFARKQEIEKRLDKPALKQRIKRIAKRIFKDVRKKEVQRKKG